MLRNSKHAGYFLYHSIGMYPDKEEDLAKATAEFAQIWAAPDDKQWGYVLSKRQDFIDYWRRIINAPKGSMTTCESVTDGMHKMMRALPEGLLRGKRVLIAEDCFPSMHFLLAGLAPKMGFTLDTVPKRDGASWVLADDFMAQWGRDVGLALLTWVTSTASARVDLAPLVAHGREMGSMIGVDITQAAGLIPFDAVNPKVDFVLSTSLKWMCGTPGAGVLYVEKALAQELQPEARGWFSQNNPFSWDLDKFEYAPDIRRFDSGTPGSIAAVASLPALKWHAAQDHAALASWNRELVDLIIKRVDGMNLMLHSPRAADERGGSVMLRFPDNADAAAMVGALGVEGLSVDFRGQLLRLSPGNVTAKEKIDDVFDLMGDVIARRARRFAGKGAAQEMKGSDVTSTDVLSALGGKLLSGDISVVDCSAPLGSDTPIFNLPDDVADGSTETLNLQRIIAPVNVIDCSAESEVDNDFLLTADCVKAWEREHGDINPGEWVVMRTDWDKRAHDAALFLNADPDPLENGAHSPGPAADCIDYLLGKGIVGWGTQCIRTDAGMAGKFNPPFPADNHLRRDTCFGLASLCNLDQLPAKGAVLIAAPLKIEQGMGSPMKAMALVPKQGT